MLTTFTLFARGPSGDFLGYSSLSCDASACCSWHCESAWKSALDPADVVDELLAAELQMGWIRIRLIPGGDSEKRRMYSVTAVGKLGVVLAEGRAPRLVVDSSVSGVTSNTSLPNSSANPTLADVFLSMPLSHSRERLVALILDVAIIRLTGDTHSCM